MFVPGELPSGMLVAGAAWARFGLADALADGARAGAEAAASCGFDGPAPAPPRADPGEVVAAPLWLPRDAGSGFVDFQHDVTVDDVTIAHREGFRSVEHLKRYTTLGMATDQGRTANVTGLAIMATLTGRGIEQTGDDAAASAIHAGGDRGARRARPRPGFPSDTADAGA